MKQQKKIQIGGETINLAKTDNIWGWRIVHPIKNEDRTINWMNLLFGGKGNLVTLLLILLILGGLYFGFKDLLLQYKHIFNDSCVQYCISDCNVAKSIIQSHL